MYRTRYLFFLTKKLSCSLQPFHLHRTPVLRHFYGTFSSVPLQRQNSPLVRTKANTFHHTNLLYTVVWHRLISSTMDILTAAAGNLKTNPHPQERFHSHTAWKFLLYPWQYIMSSRATNYILSPAQHFTTVQDQVLSIMGHLQMPSKWMLSRTPGLLCRTVPISLLEMRIGAAVPRKVAGGTSQQKSLLFQVLFQ